MASARGPASARGCLTFPAGEPPFPGARDVAERIEAGVFRSRFGETSAALASYYTDHLPQTAFVLAHDDGWAGMMRLGLPGPRTALSLEDAVAPPFDTDVETDLAARSGEPVVLLDVLTAAIRSRFRNRRIFERMVGATARTAAEHRCTHVVAMADRRVLAYFRTRRLPYTLHSDLHHYYGSPATGVASVEVAELDRWLAGRAA